MSDPRYDHPELRPTAWGRLIIRIQLTEMVIEDKEVEICSTYPAPLENAVLLA